MMGKNRKHAYLPCFDSSCCSNWIKTLVGNHQIAMRCAAVLPNWRALLVKWLQTTSNICHMVGAHRGIKQKGGHLQQCSVSTGKFQKEVGYFLYKYIMCRAVCSEIVSSHFHRLCVVTIVVYNCTAGKAGPRRRTQTQGNKRKETTLFAVIRYLKMQTYKIQTQPRRKPGS